MPPRLIRLGRMILVLMAVSLAFVAARKGNQAARYFSAPMEISGAVTVAAFDRPVMLARGNPRARDVIEPVPTRLDVQLAEHPGVMFQVWLPQNPERHPKLPAAGDQVTLNLPGRWQELEVGERVLAFGLRRGDQVLVNPSEYPYSAEYRTAFLAAGAGVGAFIAALGALRMRVESSA